MIIYLPLFIDQAPLTRPEIKNILVGEKLHEGAQMYLEVADRTAPLAAWFHSAMDYLFGRSLLARHIIAFVLTFFLSVYFGIVLITKKVFSENTFIPSLIFSILFTFSFDTLSLTDELLGFGFLLLVWNNLFKEIEFRMPRDETTFNLGLYVSFASLFSFAYVIFLFAVLVILFLYSRSTIRKVLLLIFGFLLPHLLVLAISFYNGGLEKIWQYYYLSNLGYNKEFLVSIKGILILAIVPLTYLLISIFMLNRLARFSKYQSELLQSVFLWGGFCFIYFLFAPDLRPQSMIVLVPVLAFLFTHFLLLIRRKKFAEMNIWILIAGTVLISYLARYDVLGGVKYDSLFVADSSIDVKGKRLLVLAPGHHYFTNNKAATPYINWKLAQSVFNEPEYYQSVVEVYEAFVNDPPDLIIDPENKMKPFLTRIPALRNEYVRRGDSYVRKTNN